MSHPCAWVPSEAKYATRLPPSSASAGASLCRSTLNAPPIRRGRDCRQLDDMPSTLLAARVRPHTRLAPKATKIAPRPFAVMVTETCFRKSGNVGRVGLEPTTEGL